MGLFAPWFLLGLAGLAAPLYLHLLRRQTTNPRPFSSLMFFEPRTQASMRHRRLRYLLLLALRLALLALLVLVFADPYVLRPTATLSGNRLTLLVLDHSFSMQATDHGVSRLAAAQRQAAATLAGVTGPVEVMTLGAHLAAVTKPEQDRAAQQAAIAGVNPGFSHADFGELMRGLRAVAGSTSLPITVHLFSDLRQTSLPGNFADLALPANLTLIPHAVGGIEPNWTVESVKAPSELWGSPRDSKPARVEAVIAGYNSPAAQRQVALVVNGQTVATQTVTVPASGRVTATFDTLNPPYGWSRCEVRLLPQDGDTFPADDHSDFAVRRADPQRVLFIHNASDQRSPLYFGAALAAGDGAAFSLQPVSAGAAAQQSFSQFALVVLSDVPDLPAEATAALEQYVRTGGGLLIAAGADTRTLPVFGGAIVTGHNYNERYLAVGDSDPSYPSTALLGGWPNVRFYYAVQVSPGDARVVARLSDQTPLLLDRKVGEGHVVLFASGFDNLTNDFPLHPGFVPFVQETARYLAGDDIGGPQPVDAFLTLRTAKETGVAVSVTGPGGGNPLSLAQATSAETLPLTQAGFYQVRSADGRDEVVAVNPDRRESDLSVIPADTLALWRGAPAGGSGGTPAATTAAGPARTPVSIWWYIMLLLLLAAVIESLVAARYLAIRRDEAGTVPAEPGAVPSGTGREHDQPLQEVQ